MLILLCSGDAPIFSNVLLAVRIPAAMLPTVCPDWCAAFVC
eukprot:COSAG01_NODE_68565_length_263_cov_4.067073_1_plen_40_part_01